MHRIVSKLHASLMVSVLGCSVAVAQPEVSADEVQVAVVGGLTLSGVWQHVAADAEQALGLRITTTVSSPKEGVTWGFAQGKAQILIIHSSDEASALQAQDLGTPMRVWAWNEHVLVGPRSDPAQVRGLSGKDAMAALARTKSPFVAFRDPGSYGIVQRLWRQLGIRPEAEWVRMDTEPQSKNLLKGAAEQNAYAVVGHIPVRFNKIPLPDTMEVLVQGDPNMRRPYVMLTPGPRHRADETQRLNAERVADYLLSEQGQAALSQANQLSAGVWLYPRKEGLPTPK